MNDYLSQILGPDSDPSSVDSISSWMEEVSGDLRQLNKRMKHKEGHKKKKNDKMKKRLRNLEKEYQQLHQLMLLSIYQSQMQASAPKKKGKKTKKGKKAKKKHPFWWLEAVMNSLPKALDLATVSVDRLPPRRQPILALPAPQDRN